MRLCEAIDQVVSESLVCGLICWRHPRWWRQHEAKWLQHSNATLSHYVDSKLVLEHMLGATSIPLTVLVVAAAGFERRK